MISGPDSVPALEELWQSLIPDTYGGIVRPWTSKQRGQMKQFRKACPPGAARAVLEACISDWPQFVNRTKSHAAAWSVPARPDVGFLLRFAEIAVNFRQARTRPKVHVPPTPKPIVALVRQVAHPSPGEEKASLEEVMAL